MYKVLLVDDERLELNTLKNYVDWKKLGIGTVYTANNGLQALETADFKKPDIVFTDIRMPVMDGIEFAKQLREKDKRVKIIFLTGYDEMDFIRQAFRLSATDYILKPFLVEDIERVVKGILVSLEQEQTVSHSRVHAERKIIDNIFKDDMQPAETLIGQFFAMENREEDTFRYSVIGLYGKSGNPPEKDFFREFPEVFYYVELQELNLLLLKTSVECHDVAESMAVYLYKNQENLGVVYMEGEHRLAEARIIRGRFEKAADAAFYLDSLTPASLSELLRGEKKAELAEEERKKLHILRKDITAQLSHGDSKLCFERLEDYLNICREACPSIYKNYIIRLYNHINDELVIENEELARQYPAMRFQGKTIVQLAEEANNDSQIKEGLIQYLNVILTWYCSLQENANYRVVVYVEDYIENHYMEPISVEMIASEIGLSPNYVRSIFKSGSGMTIKNYLSEYRLDKACKLLKNTSAKVSRVASMVGYDNVSYFCAIFQKRFGKTPNEWRRGL